MRRIALGFIAWLLAAQIAPAGPLAAMQGEDRATEASSTNPVPVRVYGGGGGVPLTSVVGVNGTTVHSAANPLGTALYTGGAVNSATNPVFTTLGGVATGSITNANSAIAAVDTTVTLAAASRVITINTSPDAATVYVDFTGGAATSADFPIYAGSSLTVELGAAISSYHYIGATATGNIGTCAH